MTQAAELARLNPAQAPAVGDGVVVTGTAPTTTEWAPAGTGSGSGVTTFNGRTGAVTQQLSDITSAGGAPIDAPTFTGIASATTAPLSDSSPRLATTAFVMREAGNYLLLSGGQLSGALTLAADPSTAAEAATKQYVDDQVASGGGPGGGIPEAPNDGNAYARQSLGWSNIGSSFLPIAGGTLSGMLNANGGLISMGSAGVLFSPTGSASVTINPSSLGHLNNVDLGQSTPAAATVTTLTVNGVATLSADPTQPLQAATKQYVDANAGGGGGISEAEADLRYLQLTGGQLSGALGIQGADITVGTDVIANGQVWAGGNLTISGTSDLLGNVACGANLNVTGPIYAAQPVYLPDDPTQALQAATKQYVDAQAGGGGAGAGVSVGDTPPATPVQGDLWFDSEGGQLYVWFVDSTSAQWVVVANGGGGGGGPAMGVVDGSDAGPGEVGEFIFSGVINSQGVLLSNNIGASVTSISLTPGDWEISGTVWIYGGGGAGTPMTLMAAWISPTGAAPPSGTADRSRVGGPCAQTNVSTSNPFALAISPCRYSSANPSQYFLYAEGQFASGSPLAAGNLSARRVR